MAYVASRVRSLHPDYRDIHLESIFCPRKEDRDELYRALVGSSHVRSLTIEGRWYTALQYRKLLYSLPCLEKVTIREYCCAEAAHALTTSICNIKSIRTVCLEQMNFLKPFLCNLLTTSTTLTVLKLDGVKNQCSFGSIRDQHAERSVAYAYATNKSLRSLHLGAVEWCNPKFRRCAESMLENEIISPKLLELSIGGDVCSARTIELLRKLLESKSCLARLSVNFYTSDYHTVGGSKRLVERVRPWMDELINGLERNQSVIHLRLRSSGLGNRDIAGKLGRFLAADSHLTELKVEGYSEVVDPCSLCHFFAGIGCNSHLRSLSVVLGCSGLVWNDEVPLQLIHALRTNETLETVAVGLNLSDFAMRAIAEAVPSFSLTDFSLFVERGRGDLAPFTSNLTEEIGLTALSMRHSSVRGRSLCVGDFLGGNRTLCRLTIDWVDAGNLAEIFGALELNTTLEYLNVAGATGRATSLRLLCASLPRFQGLREVVMGIKTFEWVTLSQSEKQAFCENGSLQRVVNDIYYWCREEDDRAFLDLYALRNRCAPFVDGRGGRALWSSILTKLSRKRCVANLSVVWNCLRNRPDWACAGL